MKTSEQGTVFSRALRDFQREVWGLEMADGSLYSPESVRSDQEPRFLFPAYSPPSDMSQVTITS